MGAAKKLVKTARWEPTYRFLSPIVTIASLPVLSWRKVKAAFRSRSLARSNAMHHPLKRKSRAERKEIMRAQDEFNRHVLSILAPRRHELAGDPTASRVIRGANSPFAASRSTRGLNRVACDSRQIGASV
jgi:hypothetical protein